MAAHKATPGMLGWGMARMAGEHLRDRNAVLQAQMDAAMGEQPVKKRKKNLSEKLGVKQ